MRPNAMPVVNCPQSGSRTPIPCMKRSRICTGSRRVAPVPGLSSIRTPISVGPVADMEVFDQALEIVFVRRPAVLVSPLATAMATMSATAAPGVGCAPVIW